MAQLFSNNAKTYLAAQMPIGSTTLVVQDAMLFPVILNAGDFFILTLIGRNSNGFEVYWEIIKVTATSGATFTVERAQEGTQEYDWAQGAEIALRATAGTFANMSAGGGLPLGSTVLTSADAAQLEPEFVPFDGELRLRSAFPQLAELTGDLQAFAPEYLETEVPLPISGTVLNTSYKTIAIGDTLLCAYSHNNNATCYLATSINKGVNWSFKTISLPSGGNYNLCFFEHYGGSRLLVGFSYNSQTFFYWSDNLGTTWTQVLINGNSTFSVSCDLDMFTTGARYIYICAGASLLVFDVVTKQSSTSSAVITDTRVLFGDAGLYYQMYSGSTLQNAYHIPVTAATSGAPTIGTAVAVPALAVSLSQLVASAVSDATRSGGTVRTLSCGPSNNRRIYLKRAGAPQVYTMDYSNGVFSQTPTLAFTFTVATAFMSTLYQHCSAQAHMFLQGRIATNTGFVTIDLLTGDATIQHHRCRVPANANTEPVTSGIVRAVCELHPDSARGFVTNAAMMTFNRLHFDDAKFLALQLAGGTVPSDDKSDIFYDNYTGELIAVKPELRTINSVQHFSLWVKRWPLAADYSEYVQTPATGGVAIKVKE